jgi:hypothetical protein
MAALSLLAIARAEPGVGFFFVFLSNAVVEETLFLLCGGFSTMSSELMVCLSSKGSDLAFESSSFSEC